MACRETEQDLDHLIDAELARIQNLTDQELRTEIAARGGDFEQMAEESRSILDSAAALASRQSGRSTEQILRGHATSKPSKN